MATQSPFSWLADVAEQLANRFSPPDWMADELQNRVVLFLNHVLMQEPQAQARLLRLDRQSVVRLQWREFYLQLQPTPAGLLERLEGDQAEACNLRLTLTDTSPLALADAALRGEKPAMRIEGDVQLAAEVNWLVDNLRWDAEEDLARLIGDAPAHALAQAATGAAQALRHFVASRQPAPTKTTGQAPSTGSQA